MDINSKGIFLSMRVQLNAMEKQEPRFYTSRHGERDIGRGAIVNIASAHSFVPLPNKASYIAAKHADLGLLKSAGEISHARLISICSRTEYGISGRVCVEGGSDQCFVSNVRVDAHDCRRSETR